MTPILKLRDWGSLIGIVATFITVVTVHLKDRELIQRHESIINAYESHGTPAVTSMKATYDEHFRASDARLDKLETAVIGVAAGISDMKADVRSLVVGQKELKDSLDEHKRSSLPK